MGYTMPILKWKPRFRFEEDPPVVPIWVSLYNLPVEYMHPEVIFSMATAIGQPLKVDTPILNMTRPSVARFCVEVDLLKELPKSLKIGKRGRKHEQIFTDEHVASYCPKSCKLGQKESDCRIGKPFQQNVVADKKSDQVVKKKGIKMPKQKVTLGSKQPQEKTDVEVEIILHLHKVQLRKWEFRFKVRLRPKIEVPQVEISPTENQFSVLSDVAELENKNASDEEDVENVFVEKLQHENNSIVVSGKNETLALAFAPQLNSVVVMHSDDYNIRTQSLIDGSDDEYIHSDEERWSEGDKFDLEGQDTMHGGAVVPKKRGR
ncbi:OLC1v1036676C1 [Oldenlandia corymbosa var. corymbosa]|uniref:OLC1v1036676C1 n=1 Tax=Oldenlandia corymbosa var. corymbosa TaxID=529605 RepID=A0AAV1CWM8_OLDCO|nr:OLC1v1036676C1 [Oldenlandia corymbosa var. corymbosa]